MVSIRYGHSVAAYDANGWRSIDLGLAEMLNALRIPADIAHGQDDRELAVARHAIARLRAGEIIDVARGEPRASPA